MPTNRLAPIALIWMCLLTALGGCAAPPPTATEESAVKTILGPYVGETCAGYVRGYRNVDSIVEKDGVIFVHHRYNSQEQGAVSDSSLHDAGLRVVHPTGETPGGWPVVYTSDSGALEYYAPVPGDPKHLRVRVVIGRIGESTYTCHPSGA